MGVTKTILGIKPSGRPKGNTDIILNEFLRPARERGHHVETVNLMSMNLRHCTGCFGCNNADLSCVIKDDLEGLKDKIQKADAIALAAPCFAIGAPSILKTVMDRTAAWAFDLIAKRLPKKFGAAVLVGGAEPDWLSMQRFAPAQFLQLYNCEAVGLFTIGGVGLRGEILLSSTWLKRINALGENLAQSVEDGIAHVFPYTELEDRLVCPNCLSDGFHVDRRGRCRCVVCSAEMRGFHTMKKSLATRVRYAAKSIYTPELADYHVQYVGNKISRVMGASEEVGRRAEQYFDHDVVPIVDFEIPQLPTEEGQIQVQWDDAGEKAFKENVPPAFRSFVRKAAEKKALARGIKIMTRETFLRIKRESGN